MINVYLDDNRPCPKGFKLARSVQTCIELIRSNKVDVLSLDYNLGIGKPSGYELVRFMVANKIYAKTIIIHSANPFGRIKMYKLLMEHKPKKVKLFVRPEPIFY